MVPSARGTSRALPTSYALIVTHTDICKVHVEGQRDAGNVVEVTRRGIARPKVRLSVPFALVSIGAQIGSVGATRTTTGMWRHRYHWPSKAGLRGKVRIWKWIPQPLIND